MYGQILERDKSGIHWKFGMLKNVLIILFKIHSLNFILWVQNNNSIFNARLAPSLFQNQVTEEREDNNQIASHNSIKFE